MECALGFGVFLGRKVNPYFWCFKISLFDHCQRGGGVGGLGEKGTTKHRLVVMKQSRGCEVQRGEYSQYHRPVRGARWARETPGGVLREVCVI